MSKLAGAIKKNARLLAHVGRQLLRRELRSRMEREPPKGTLRHSAMLKIANIENPHGITLRTPVRIMQTRTKMNCLWQHAQDSCLWEAPYLEKSMKRLHAPCSSMSIFDFLCGERLSSPDNRLALCTCPHRPSKTKEVGTEYRNSSRKHGSLD